MRTKSVSATPDHRSPNGLAAARSLIADARWLRTGQYDFLQINYSLAERDADQALLPLALEKKVAVIADETRPFLQGARLTAWELTRDGIDTTVITDNMAGHFMQRGEISCVIVGADRIAANGDVANKIGTYSVADRKSVV